MRYAIGLLVALSGCLAYLPRDRQVPFDPAEFEPYGHTGTATVTGQAFLRTMGGDVRYAAGLPVLLMPNTYYTSEWFQIVVLREENLKPADPEADKYTRQTIADGEGRFIFRDLPAGEYFAVCKITWAYPGYYGYAYYTGGWAYNSFKIDADETLNIVLTR